MTDILPIETAPRDGRQVLVIDFLGGWIAKAKWTGDMWAYAGLGDLIEQIDFEPTGWVEKPEHFVQ